MPDIELTNIPPPVTHEVKLVPEEKALHLTTSAYNTMYPLTKPAHRKLILCIFAEIVISIFIYINYGEISMMSYPLVAPSLLGASTAALAQSAHQYVRKKYSFNRVCKFVVWGGINGCFTVLWIDLIITNIESLVYRILIDQAVGAPCFQLVFNIINSLWDSGEITSSTKNAFFKSLKYSYCYWPFFSILSFMFVPQSVMFPANCVANLLWNMILSRLS